MKLECKYCNKYFNKDYILYIGPYWYENNINQPMCCNCFENRYKKEKRRNEFWKRKTNIN